MGVCHDFFPCPLVCHTIHSLSCLYRCSVPISSIFCFLGPWRALSLLCQTTGVCVCVCVLNVAVIKLCCLVSLLLAAGIFFELSKCCEYRQLVHVR